MGNYLSGGCTIALYDTLGADAARFVCDQTQLSTIVCSDDLVGPMIKLKADDPQGKMKKLTTIVQFEKNITSDNTNAGKQVGIEIITFEDVIAAGKDNSSWAIYNASPEDIYMLSYTSGTTGDPKGVKLSHKMVLQCGQATNQKLPADKRLTENDVYISYLPAAHSFEQAL